MKTNQVRYSLFLVVSFIVYGSALSVTNVQVDSGSNSLRIMVQPGIWKKSMLWDT
jgi:hypothetical protein